MGAGTGVSSSSLPTAAQEGLAVHRLGHACSTDSSSLYRQRAMAESTFPLMVGQIVYVNLQAGGNIQYLEGSRRRKVVHKRN